MYMMCRHYNYLVCVRLCVASLCMSTLYRCTFQHIIAQTNHSAFV